MDKISKDIKNKDFKQIYLLYGQEDYLRKYYKNLLSKEIIPEESSLNYNYFEGEDFDLNEVIQISETLPFFSNKRLVLLENTGCFKRASDELVDYLDKLPDSTLLIFVEKDIDRRGRLYKKVKSLGSVSEMGKPSTGDLISWIEKFAKKESKTISEATCKYILETVGNDMENLKNELDKLISYLGDEKTITKDMVDQICVQEISGKIFDMVDAMSFKQTEKLLKLYQDLIEDREAPLKILFMVVRQFRIMSQVKELLGKSYSVNIIAEKTKLRNFVVEKTIRQIKEFGGKDLKKFLEECADAEADIKTGKINDKNALEILLIKFSK